MMHIFQQYSPKVRYIGQHISSILFALTFCGAALASNNPSAPINISISMNFNGEDRTVVIQWGLSYDSDGWVTHYELLRNNNVIYVGNSAYYIDNNIVLGDTYHYEVVAIDNSGDRSISTGATSITISTGRISNVYDESLAGLPDKRCVDTDGDGWGWNGNSSCLMDAGNGLSVDTSVGSCIDSDGDGYGWDGDTTCLMGSGNDVSIDISVESCIDSDGDGFGWNGVATCKPKRWRSPRSGIYKPQY